LWNLEEKGVDVLGKKEGETEREGRRVVDNYPFLRKESVTIQTNYSG